MRPLSWIAPGLLCIAIDMRITAFDLLPDPLGWLLILIGVRQIARPATVAVVALATVTSFADVLLPHKWAFIDPMTGRILELSTVRESYPQMLVFDRLSGARLAFVVLSLAVAALAMWLILRDLTLRARTAGRTSAARQLGLLRGLVPGLWIGPHLAAAAAALVSGGSYDPVWNDGLEFVVLLGLVPVAWLGVLAVLERDYAWALPASPATSPTFPTSRGPSGPHRPAPRPGPAQAQ